MTSSNEDTFVEAGTRIQESIMALIKSETMGLALDTRFSGDDIVKIMLGAQIFAVVDFVNELGLPQEIAMRVMEGGFAHTSKPDKTN